MSSSNTETSCPYTEMSSELEASFDIVDVEKELGKTAGEAANPQVAPCGSQTPQDPSPLASGEAGSAGECRHR
jgi:hypothetical protein